jgi:hypothetical protein
VKQSTMFGFLKRGGAAAAQLSQSLMKNPAFVAAVATAYRGKERLDDAAAEALKKLNVPTRSEYKRLTARLEAVERELAERPAAAPKPAAARKRAPARRKKPPTTGA